MLHELQVHQAELEIQNEELRRAQVELELARDRYLDLYDFAPVGYLTLDAGGRITGVNLVGAGLLGVDRAELLGRAMEKFIASKDLARWSDHLARVRERGVPQTCELILRPTGRDPFPVQLTSSGAPAGEGATVGVRCTLLDISERRRLEEERERRIVELVVLNQRLEQAQGQLLHADRLSTLGELTAAVAQEVNNPLTRAMSNLFLVGGFVEEIVQGRPSGSGAAVAPGNGDGPRPTPPPRSAAEVRSDLVQSLSDAREALERVSRVMSDLRIFAHPDSGGWEPANLREIVEGALRVVSAAVGARARVVTDFGVDVPPVRCRASQLAQVFMNILVNAAQASAGGGTVTVRTGRDGPEAWVEIADNGAGIPPEHRERIFEPFFTTKPAAVGAGLGLSISRDIVRAHGGRIDVRSEVGRGSTFRVVLPLDGPDPRPDPGPVGGGRTGPTLN